MREYSIRAYYMLIALLTATEHMPSPTKAEEVNRAYLFIAFSTATATATEAPTMGLHADEAHHFCKSA